ncbi:MAG: restriction endonuclease subunit S [Gammaproteobacteria bacterium]
MRSNYKPIGSYIRLVDDRNKDLKVTTLLGLSISKVFIPSVANIIGSDMANYKIIKKGQFSCSLMQVRRDKKIPVALLRDFEAAIISQAYPVFEIKDQDELLPEYLMMWMSRSEFDRHACFLAVGGVRGSLEWEDFCKMELPVPSIEKQREIVREYSTIVNRIALNEQLNQKLEETAQAIYKHWFVDFEFPISAEYAASIGKPELEGKCYKSSGGEMVFSEELGKEIPNIFNTGFLKHIATYTKNRVALSELNLNNYISTENMYPERGGIGLASTLPTSKSVSKFNVGDILISNIRPYFKKIWKAEFEGGCSNDVLCIAANNPSFRAFLYQTLEPDAFFNYVMNGSKGTKMPRGDKAWIMKYPVIIPDTKTLEKYNQVYTGIYKFKSEHNAENISLSGFSSVFLSQMTLRGKVA